MVFDENGTQVATVTSENKVHFKPISVTQILDSAVEVSTGVTTDDRIIDNPSAALLEGEPVRIVTPAPGYKLSPDHEPTTRDHDSAREVVSENVEDESQEAF
jgi:hypothetical protein